MCKVIGTFKRRGKARSEGATVIEAAICLPAMLVLVFVILQCVLIVFTSVTLHQAAMAGGRAAILENADNALIERKAREALAGLLTPEKVQFNITEGAYGPFTATRVELKYPTTVFVPVIFRGGTFEVMATNIWR